MKKYELFQFTPLREGRHKLIDALKGEYGISIHAPPRGATHDKDGKRISM